MPHGGRVGNRPKGGRRFGRSENPPVWNESRDALDLGASRRFGTRRERPDVRHVPPEKRQRARVDSPAEAYARGHRTVDREAFSARALRRPLAGDSEVCRSLSRSAAELGEQDRRRSPRRGRTRATGPGRVARSARIRVSWPAEHPSRGAAIRRRAGRSRASPRGADVRVAGLRAGPAARPAVSRSPTARPRGAASRPR